ncbi:hypothetical protein [Nocardioides houyundeii]|uniref:hypothetical protein n=1 Tax=Nocardioides houyundeii TaxID=2045452 RepID=UPI000C793965|nr:hypothetical protein [Nocardioides houyundeii]
MTEQRKTGVPDPDVSESLRASNPNASGEEGLAGEMGISSERVGTAGPGQVSTDGVRDASPNPPEPDPGPEQSAGGHEENPAEMGRKSDYPSADPRSSGEEPETGDPGLRQGRPRADDA